MANWTWSEHPDQIVPGRLDRKVYQKVVGDRLVRVVVDGNVLVTAYPTKRIDKYMRRD